MATIQSRLQALAQLQNGNPTRFFIALSVGFFGLAILLDFAVSYAHRSFEINAITDTAVAETETLKAGIEDIFVPFTQALHGAAKSTTPGNPEQTAAGYEQMMASDPRIRELRFIDPAGHNRVRVGTQDGASRTVIGGQRNSANHIYFSEATSLAVGEVFVTHIDLEVDRGEVSFPWRPVMRMITPVPGADAQAGPRGFVLLTFDASPIVTLFGNSTRDSSFNLFINLKRSPRKDSLTNMWGFTFGKLMSLNIEDLDRLDPAEVRPKVQVTRDRLASHEAIRLRSPDTPSAEGQVIGFVYSVKAIKRVAGWTTEKTIVFVVLFTMLISITWRWSRSMAQVREATAQRNFAQEHLMHAERLASLGGLVAGVAHELNTPIGNAVTLASTLSDHIKDMDADIASGQVKKSRMNNFFAELRSGVEFLCRNLDRADTLMSKFKEVAVDQSSENRRSFTLDDYVEEVAETISPRFKHSRYRLVVTTGSDLTMDSYPGPLGQVVINLINNALVHGFSGRAEGTVTVTTGAHGDSRAMIVVTDDGNGIPADIIDKIFDPFFTTRLGQGGSGLGLNIVHNIVTGVLGGTIKVTSQPDEPTRFEIIIPTTATDLDDNEEPYNAHANRAA